MPSVSLTDTSYASQLASIQRRQKFAELLTAQGNEAIPINSGGGVQAPIPWTAVLAKALSAGAGAYIAHKASDQQDQADTASRAALLASVLPGGASAPGVATPPAAVPSPGAAASPSLPPPLPQVPTPPQMPVAPPPMAPPPSDVGVPNVAPDTPMAAAPAAAPIASPPQMPPTPSPAPNAGPPASAAASPFDQSLAAAQADVHRWTMATLSPALSPTDRALAGQQLTAAKATFTELQKLQFAQQAKERDRVAEVSRTAQFINQSTSIPDAFKSSLIAGANADPDLAKTISTQMVKDAMTKKFVPATPQDLQGYPQGTVAQKDPLTDKLENIYNPVPNLMAIANEKLHAQDVGIAAGHLSLDRQRLSFDQSQKDNAALTPQSISFMAGQLLAGDPNPLQNVGRGTQGAQNIVAVRNEMYRQAQMRGMSPEQIAAMNARFFGLKSEARAAGTRVGATDVATSEVPGLAQEAIAAHAAIPQTNLVPLNRAMQMVQAGTSSPEMARAVGANQAVVNAYARSFGTGVTSDHARSEAARILQNAWGTPAYAAALTQIQRNTQVERHGAKAALDAIGSGAAAPMPSPQTGGWGKATVVRP